MAVALNDGRVFVLDLSSVLEQEGGKTVEGDETLLYSLGKGAQCGAVSRLGMRDEWSVDADARTLPAQPIVDVSFSPDGSVFVVLTSDHGYAIRSTAAPTEIILSGKLPSSTPARGPAALSGISFLAAPNAHPTALVITSLRGTVVHLVPLHRGAGAETSSTISLVLSSSSTTAPSSHFSHHAYHQPSQTLYLSSSLRGSFFALRLSLAPLASVGTEDDATFFATAASEGAESQVKIQHVVEVSTGEPVLGFVLDDSVGEEAETMGALVLHPNGVHQVMFERPRLVAVDGGPEEGIGEDVQGEQEEEKSEEEREEKEQGQGMVGLESSILVSSEVAVAIDEADPVAATLLGEEVGAAVGDEEAPAVSEDTVAERKSSITPPPVVEEAAPSVAIPESTTPLAPLASPTRSGDIKLSGSAVNAAIRSMKKHKDKSTSAAGGSASPTRERGVKQEEPPSSLAQAHTHAVPALIAGQATSASAPTATKGTNDAVANAWATGVAPAGKKGSKKDELHAEVLRELKKVEEGLPGKVAAVVKGEMEKYGEYRYFDPSARRSVC